VLLDWSLAGRLSAPLRHALIALCLYCVTGDEPSPEVLTRLLESNRKSIRIALPQDTGDPPRSRSCSNWLCRQLPLNLLLLRKAFLTLDGITRQLDPDFNAWLEPLAYVSGGVRKRSCRANLEHSIPVARPARFLSFRVNCRRNQ
jgi:hypothetical protein